MDAREIPGARRNATILELTMDTLTAFHDLGRANALEALAQVGGFRDLTDAVANHYQNLADTLTEMHATAAQTAAARDGFKAVLRECGMDPAARW
jgi:hypothetical protein